MFLDWETYYAVRWGQWKYFNYRHDALTYRCSEQFNQTITDYYHGKTPEAYMNNTEAAASNLNSPKRKMKLEPGEQLYNLHYDPFEINNRIAEKGERKWLLQKMQQYVKKELSKGHRLPAVADTKSKAFFTEIKAFANRYWEEPMDFLVETDRVVKDLPSNDNYFASIGQNWCSVVDVKLKQAIDKPNWPKTQKSYQTQKQYPPRLQNDVAFIEDLKRRAEHEKAVRGGNKNGDRWRIEKALNYSPLFTDNYTPPLVTFEHISQ